MTNPLSLFVHIYSFFEKRFKFLIPTKSKAPIFVGIMLLCGLSLPAQAFSKIGHQLVCELAYQTLSEVNQQKIDNYMRMIPKKHQKIINRYARVKKDAVVTFANACLWADAIKSDRSLKIVYKKYKKWHYLNVERDDLKVTQETCSENCVTQAIAIHQQQLQTSKKPWDKIEALMFLGHWLADIHQPMHVSYASDFGGNKLKIKWLTDDESQSKDKKIVKCKNMHVLWDDCLLRQWDKKVHNKILFKTHLVALIKEIDELPEEKLTEIKKGDQWQWATESLQLARNSQVKYCQHQDDNNFCLPFSVKTMYLLPDYHHQFSPIALERIMLAGLRLSKLLQRSI